MSREVIFKLSSILEAIETAQEKKADKITIGSYVPFSEKDNPDRLDVCITGIGQKTEMSEEMREHITKYHSGNFDPKQCSNCYSWATTLYEIAEKRLCKGCVEAAKSGG